MDAGSLARVGITIELRACAPALSRHVIHAALDEYLESAHDARLRSGGSRAKPGLAFVKQRVGARLHGSRSLGRPWRQRPHTGGGTRGGGRRDVKQQAAAQPHHSPPPRLRRSSSARLQGGVSNTQRSGGPDNLPRFPGVDEWEMLQAYQVRISPAVTRPQPPRRTHPRAALLYHAVIACVLSFLRILPGSHRGYAVSAVACAPTGRW